MWKHYNICIGFSYCPRTVLLKLPKVSTERRTRINETELSRNQKSQDQKVSESIERNLQGNFKQHIVREAYC